MLLADVNVLVSAHREDAVDHPRYREWLESVLASDAAYGVRPGRGHGECGSAG